ncbi:putative O-methyltransferase [Halobacteroides halobius DSM 5150]|uniref:tRNA 5-hydroxyuridine methyltransferase n=1 Tax=Halobacteroides halobius (strain ATCC 35273 / DSM 5150 / MD-1) TaxID=748449 RepID=L0KCZ8_HALHC|nr:O-methyltransferase [Halobacteroides halobius]AGB41953.1 putative O-methyltransferase [Halobacteroides halobius DSM 5150]
MSNIVQDWIIDYLREKQSSVSDEIKEVEEVAVEKNIPIIEPEVGNLLQLLIKIHRPQRVLELGTAIGYSTLWLAEDYSGEIVTIELKERDAKIARKFFQSFNCDNIELLVGDALELMPKLEGKFDLIFIDAAKGQYMNFLEEGMKLLTDGGLIVADDVLFKGMIADDRFYHPRYNTLTKRLREYVTTVMDDKRLSSTIIPLGDGVAISVKKEENE